jgi:hypothetical protein
MCQYSHDGRKETERENKRKKRKERKEEERTMVRADF